MDIFSKEMTKYEIDLISEMNINDIEGIVDNALMSIMSQESVVIGMKNLDIIMETIKRKEDNEHIG